MTRPLPPPLRLRCPAAADSAPAAAIFSMDGVHAVPVWIACRYRSDERCRRDNHVRARVRGKDLPGVELLRERLAEVGNWARPPKPRAPFPHTPRNPMITCVDVLSVIVDQQNYWGTHVACCCVNNKGNLCGGENFDVLDSGDEGLVGRIVALAVCKFLTKYTGPTMVMTLEQKFLFQRAEHDAGITFVAVLCVAKVPS